MTSLSSSPWSVSFPSWTCSRRTAPGWCLSIMDVFIKHQQEHTRDPVILNALLHICKTMHDFVNALTLEDEKRSLALLLNGFICMAVNQLAMETSRVMRGSHSHKTAAFVRCS
eukprot:XP_014013852.1 PREDICTED: UPF0505 protein C16orf62 homolog [Salmo salar]